MSRRLLCAGVVAMSVAAALALRVAPAYAKVFTPYGVAFQENDAWYHMRTAHNQLAHFPRRSGFDPYAIYPGGQDIPTGPVWDWMIASAAWIAGLGAPPDALIDRVGAWMPAVVGALFPVVAFFLAKVLAGDVAGMFAAWSVALMPGMFLWLSQLGLADHHSAESFFALATLAAMCAAVDKRAWRLALVAGAAFGALLGTRPAAAFIVGIFLLTAAFPDRVLASVTLVVLAVGAILFVPVGSLVWSNYAWLLVGTGIAAMIAAFALDVFWTRKKWPRIALAIPIAGVIAIGAVAASRWKPELIASLWANVRRLLGAANDASAVATVRELRPLLDTEATPMAALVHQLGLAWVVAIPALAWVVMRAIRLRRGAWILFATWSLVMTIAAFLQLRMVVYYAPIAAILCGLVCGTIVEALPRLRTFAALILGAGIAVACVPMGVALIRRDAGPTTGWVQATDWLRANTPEPMGGASAYARYYARRHDRPFAYPASAYGVAVWWDEGYWVEALARRIPSSNGTQAGAADTANFLSQTDPRLALDALAKLGARYTIADPSLPLFDLRVPSAFDAIVAWSGRPSSAYYRVIYSNEDGRWRPMILYLPDYFRTMIVRMYLFDAQPVAATGTWIVSSVQGSVPGFGRAEVLRWKRHFDSQTQAEAFANEYDRDRDERLTLGSFDTTESCVDLDAVEGLKLVFNSDPGPIQRGHPVRAVKIFEFVSQRRTDAGE
jgi:oligosaccharyl transferase (archaeosortase A-associated)